MADYQALKIPIFTGINDTPRLPTADEGGNISHFYDEYNKLIDLLQTDISTVETSISTVETNTTDLSNSFNGLDTRVSATETEVAKIPTIETIANDANTRSINNTTEITKFYLQTFPNFETNITTNQTNINTLISQITGIQNSIDTLNNANLSNRINELSDRVDSLATSIDNLTREVFPDPNLFLFENVATQDDGTGIFSYTIDIPKDGYLKFIYLKNATNPNDISFKKNGFFFSKTLESSFSFLPNHY